MKTINGDILLTKNLHADKSEFQNQMVDGEKLTGDIHPTTWTVDDKVNGFECPSRWQLGEIFTQRKIWHMPLPHMPPANQSNGKSQIPALHLDS